MARATGAFELGTLRHESCLCSEITPAMTVVEPTRRALAYVVGATRAGKRTFLVRRNILNARRIRGIVRSPPERPVSRLGAATQAQGGQRWFAV